MPCRRVRPLDQPRTPAKPRLCRSQPRPCRSSERSPAPLRRPAPMGRPPRCRRPAPQQADLLRALPVGRRAAPRPRHPSRLPRHPRRARRRPRNPRGPARRPPRRPCRLLPRPCLRLLRRPQRLPPSPQRLPPSRQPSRRARLLQPRRPRLQQTPGRMSGRRWRASSGRRGGAPRHPPAATRTRAAARSPNTQTPRAGEAGEARVAGEAGSLARRTAPLRLTARAMDEAGARGTWGRACLARRGRTVAPGRGLRCRHPERCLSGSRPRPAQGEGRRRPRR